MPTSRFQELHDGYTNVLVSFNADVSVTILGPGDALDARARDLHAVLRPLGITDLANEGSLVLGGEVAVTHGVRRGVRQPSWTPGQLSTSTPLDFNTAGVFDYLDLRSVARTAQPAATRDRARASGAPSVVAASGVTVSSNAAPAEILRTRLAMTPNPVLDIDEAIIAAEHIQLQDGTELRLDPQVRYLTILALRLTTGTGCRITWQPAVRAAKEGAGAKGPATSYDPFNETSVSDYHSPDGGDGEPGDPGETGASGESGPTVELWCLDANRLPDFELGGGTGGQGGRGGYGGIGGHGAKGLSAKSKGLNCVRLPGYGGDGGDAGNAGRGGHGGPGGKGGDVNLYLSDATHTSVFASGLRLDLSGGLGGSGGRAGIPGLLVGLGGEAGDAKSLVCKARPERAGSPGGAGNAADEGEEGAQGETGTITAAVITEAEFRDKWTAPQIRRVTPGQVVAGDTIEVIGSQFPRAAQVTIAGAAATTTVVSDTLLQAVVPAVPTGWAEVLVTGGSQDSNPAAVEVLPSVTSVSPSVARVGQTVRLQGSGFAADSRVLYRGQALTPDSVGYDGAWLDVTIPRQHHRSKTSVAP
jgi:IPT/TIG domain